MSSHRHLFVFLLGMYDRITESLGMFSCSRYCQTYFQRGYSNLKSSSCPISSPTLDTMCLFHFSDSGSVQWSLHGGLNLYSSMTSQVAHCLVYLLTTWISSCELPFQVLPIFPFSCLFLIDLQKLFIYSKDSFFCQRQRDRDQWGEEGGSASIFSNSLASLFEILKLFLFMNRSSWYNPSYRFFPVTKAFCDLFKKSFLISRMFAYIFF